MRVINLLPCQDHPIHHCVISVLNNVLASILHYPLRLLTTTHSQWSYGIIPLLASERHQGVLLDGDLPLDYALTARYASALVVCVATKHLSTHPSVLAIRYSEHRLLHDHLSLFYRRFAPLAISLLYLSRRSTALREGSDGNLGFRLILVTYLYSQESIGSVVLFRIFLLVQCHAALATFVVAGDVAVNEYLVKNGIPLRIIRWL